MNLEKGRINYKIRFMVISLKQALWRIWQPCKMKKNQKSIFLKANNLLDAIKKTQIKYGGDTMISEDKISTEILYNRYDIFKKLFEYYMYASTLMFLLLIIQIFKDRSKYINISVKVFKYTILGSVCASHCWSHCSLVYFRPRALE